MKGHKSFKLRVSNWNPVIVPIKSKDEFIRFIHQYYVLTQRPIKNKTQKKTRGFLNIFTY